MIPRRIACLLTLIAPLLSCGEDFPGYAMDDVLRMNHLQCEGTHNSYHQLPNDNPLIDWNYEHAPLDVQLDEQGVRKFELDLHWNEAMGLHLVQHLQLIDPNSTCDTFTECLETIRGWSTAHAGHHPIFIQLEPKNYPSDPTEPFVQDALAAMDAEILAVFGDAVITPDEVRGTAATLDEAVTTVGWPTLGQSRGRVLFFYNCDRELCREYANNGVNLDGRVVFADSEPGDAWSAIRFHNGPTDPDIPIAVAAGYIVRTRAESLTTVLEGGESNLADALASGAQLISTDFPAPRTISPEVSYFVEIPGGTPSRCNPINAPAECTSLDIEDPASF